MKNKQLVKENRGYATAQSQRFWEVLEIENGDYKQVMRHTVTTLQT